MIPSNVQTLPRSISSASLRVVPSVLSRSGSLPRRPRTYQQIRAFRFGLWSSYLDVNFQKELSRRQRLVKHKYVEALHRKLLWDRPLPMHIRHLKQSGLKSFMCSAWRGQDSRPGGRWVNSDDLEYMNRKNEDRKESGIEDVEQSALDKLLEKQHHNFIRAKSRIFGPGWSSSHSAWVLRPQPREEAPTDYGSNSSTVYNSEGFRKRFESENKKEHEDNTEYEIDPITNRKVPKRSSQQTSKPSTSNDIPAKTFRGYRSQFGNFEPPKTQSNEARNLPSQLSTTESDTAFLFENNPPSRSQAEDIHHLTKYEEAEDFKSTRQYDTSETEIDYSNPDEAGLKAYDDKVSQGAPTSTPEEAASVRDVEDHDGLKAYDDKVENDVREFFPSADEETKQVDHVQQARDQYDAFKDIAPSRTISSNKSTNEDKVLKSRQDYEHSDARLASDRQTKADRVLESIRNAEEFIAAERTKNFDQFGSELLYPILKSIKEYEAHLKDKKTNARGFSQDDGVDPVLRTIREYRKNLLSQVGAHNAASLWHIQKAALDPLLNAIIDYEAFLLRNDGSKESLHNGEDAADKADEEFLRAYDAKARFYQRPREYESFVQGRHEPGSVGMDGKAERSTAEVNSRYSRLEDLLESSTTTATSEPSVEPKSWSHLPQRIRNLFAETAKSDEAISSPPKVSKTRAINGGDPALNNYLKEVEKSKKRKALEQSYETSVAEADAKLSAERLRQLKTNLKSDRLESQLENARAVKKAVEPSNAGIPLKNSPRTTGNFVRDFPEEFQGAWTVSEGSSGLTPKNLSEEQVEADIQNSERAYINGLGDQAAFLGSPGAQRIEPSLDRPVSSIGRVVKKQDPVYNAHLANLESQKEKNALREKHRELVCEVRSIYEDTYGTIDSNHRQVPPAIEENTPSKQETVSASNVTENQEPTIYKILAYDPTMQSISSAETTSVVPDASSPLTPSEVLLRLSNPAKFFPHFEPLRKQGYEIVSGSGDVLVFRKVREAVPASPADTITTTARADAPVPVQPKNITNPIDGMTRSPIPSTGDFASPTGFVNHDIPRGTGSGPPFKSNIDVRREEPVFSGKKNWEYEDEPKGKKKGGYLKKVLIGAGWLGACSYALGVVGEYFKSGGADGLGPKGF